MLDPKCPSTAGFIGLCSWFPLREELDFNILSNITTPIFVAHSRDDNVVPIGNGEILCNTLKILGMQDVTWKAYDDGGHWVNKPQGVDDMVAFIRKSFSIR